MSKYAVFSGPYFPTFGLNTERYWVSLRIQSECAKTQTRKNSVFGHFPRSEFDQIWLLETAIQRCSEEKVFWKYAENIHENTHAEVRLQ